MPHRLASRRPARRHRPIAVFLSILASTLSELPAAAGEKLRARLAPMTRHDLAASPAVRQFASPR